jgi:hypothetical protein
MIDRSLGRPKRAENRIMNAIDRLKRCEELLSFCGRISEECLTKGNQQDEPPAIMLKRAFAFGRKTIASMILLIRGGQDHALFLPVIIRPFYELSIRIQWACREKLGWQRLQVYLADENRKWAGEARRMEFVSDLAESILRESEEVLNRSDEHGASIQKAPDLQQMLRGIEERNIKDGLAEKSEGGASIEYTNVYRTLCRPAHAHMTVIAIDKPDAFLQQAVIAVILATRALLHAYCHVGAKNKSEEIEAVEQEMCGLLAGCKELNHDNLPDGKD